MVNKEKRFETIYTQGASWSIVVDVETGVNYLVHDIPVQAGDGARWRR